MVFPLTAESSARSAELEAAAEVLARLATRRVLAVDAALARELLDAPLARERLTPGSGVQGLATCAPVALIKTPFNGARII